jgi:CHAT domain-containing protein
LRALAPLPATQTELKAMAAVMRASANDSLRLASQAREGQVRSDERLAMANILAVATHGLMPSELQGLQEPGLVMTPPDQPSDDDDGLWTASEVSLQTINASLVVLSACNTASSEGTPGADSLSALARAFFLSGAGAVLASRWSVPDEPTAALTVEALDGIANGKLDQPHALQAAMKAVRSGKTAQGADLPGWTTQWSHPSAWAAFSIYSSRLAN